MAHLESLILFDPQERSRETLQFGYDRDGYKVYATADGDDAHAMAQTRVAQLVVVCIPLPHGPEDDWEDEALELVGTLREEAGTRELPIVVLGERSAREKSLRAGADEFIARPAFIRDVLTLSSLAAAMRQDGDDEGVAGMLQDYELYFLVRALSVAERTGSIEIERGDRTGEVHFVKGEVVSARCGRANRSMSGLPAFNHLLLWGEATIQLRMTPPSAERKISMSTEELLEKGAQFAREFEALASRIGGGMAVFRSEPRKAAEARAQIPGEVMALLKHFDGKRPFIDVVQDSSFKPLDTIKIAWRLQQLGVIERVQEPGGPSTLSSQLAVRDWLLGAPGHEHEAERSTVTEAGRRAAEAFHAAHEARTDPTPAEELLEDTQKVFTMTAAAEEDDEHHEPAPPPTQKKRSRKTYPTGRLQAERKHKPVKVELRPSQPEPAKPIPTDIDETIPFSKFELLDLPEVSEKKLHPHPVSSPVPAHAEKHEPKHAPAPAAKHEPPKHAPAPHPAPAAAKPAAPAPAPHPAPAAAKPPAGTKFTKKPKGKQPTPQQPTSKEVHFSDLEEDFFAREAELHEVGPVDNFDDLEPSSETSPKRKSWFGGDPKNSKFSSQPKAPPKKR